MLGVGKVAGFVFYAHVCSRRFIGTWHPACDVICACITCRGLQKKTQTCVKANITHSNRRVFSVNYLN